MGFIAAATIKRYEPYFSPRFKTPCHVVQIVLIHAVLGLAAARLFMKDAPKGRSNSIGLGMVRLPIINWFMDETWSDLIQSAKSLMIIFYQLGTEHVNCLKRWASLKAFAILNVLEIVFWGAVAFLTLKASVNKCVGKGCAMGWAIVGLAVVLG